MKLIETSLQCLWISFEGYDYYTGFKLNNLHMNQYKIGNFFTSKDIFLNRKFYSFCELIRT